MADVKDAIENSFRDLLKSRRYKSISVKDICEEAHISRKTFYSVFRDKEDIVTYIFKRDVIGPLHQINSIFTLSEAGAMTGTIQQKIYKRIFDDGAFYRDLVSSMKGRDDTFIRVVTNSLYDFNMSVLKRTGHIVDETHADYVAYYFSSSQAMIMQKWIFDNYVIPVDEFARLYTSISLEYWLKVGEEYI